MQTRTIILINMLKPLMVLALATYVSFIETDLTLRIVAIVGACICALIIGFKVKALLQTSADSEAILPYRKWTDTQKRDAFREGQILATILLFVAMIAVTGTWWLAISGPARHRVGVWPPIAGLFEQLGYALRQSSLQ